MDYDTWKTTDFEYEAASEAQDALEAVQLEFSNDFFDAYMTGNQHVINEVDDYLIDDEDFFKMLRDNYEPKSYVKDRGDKMHKAYMEFVGKVCDKIAEGYDSHDKLGDARNTFKL